MEQFSLLILFAAMVVIWRWTWASRGKDAQRDAAQPDPRDRPGPPKRR